MQTAPRDRGLFYLVESSFSRVRSELPRIEQFGVLVQPIPSFVRSHRSSDPIVRPVQDASSIVDGLHRQDAPRRIFCRVMRIVPFVLVHPASGFDEVPVL
jgi:hypothetical protein